MTLTENFFKHVCETVVRKKMHHILHSLIFPSHAFDCCHFLLNLFAATYLLLSFNSQCCEVSEQEDAPGEGVYSHPVHAAPVVTYTTNNNQAYSWSQIYSCRWQAIVKKNPRNFIVITVNQKRTAWRNLGQILFALDSKDNTVLKIAALCQSHVCVLHSKANTYTQAKWPTMIPVQSPIHTVRPGYWSYQCQLKYHTSKKIPLSLLIYKMGKPNRKQTGMQM